MMWNAYGKYCFQREGHNSYLGSHKRQKEAARERQREEARIHPQTDVQRAMHHVAFWWNKRVADGCQLKHLEQFRPSLDYKGNGPWFRKVATSALYRDFCMSNDHVLSKITFYIAFMRVAGGQIRGRKSTHGSILDERGRVLIRPLISFYVFIEGGD